MKDPDTLQGRALVASFCVALGEVNKNKAGLTIFSFFKWEDIFTERV